MQTAQAQALVALLQAAFPHRPLPNSSVRLYADELAPFDAHFAERAVRKLIRSSVFMPTIAEVIEEAREEEWANRPQLPAVITTQEEFVAAAPEEIRPILDAYFEKFGRKGFADPQAKARAILEDTERDGQELPPVAKEPTGRLAIVPSTESYRPDYVQDGPKCGGCGRKTWRDGGRYWFCGICGWLKERRGA